MSFTQEQIDQMVLFPYNRLIPPGGVSISHFDVGASGGDRWQYVDVNDMSMEIRNDIEKRRWTDPAIDEFNEHYYVKQGLTENRRFLVYCYFNANLIGYCRLLEKLGNPDYGIGDLLIEKYILAENRQSPLLKILARDIYVLLSLTEMFRCVYGHAKAKSDSQEVDFSKNPCMAPVSNFKETEKTFLTFKKAIATDVGSFLVYEFPAEKWRNIDWSSFMSVAYGKTSVEVSKWVNELTVAAAKIKQQVQDGDPILDEKVREEEERKRRSVLVAPA